MNIIFYRYNSICEPDYIDAFKALGLNVVEDNDGMDQDMDIETRLERLGNMIAEATPLFIFSINFFPLLSIICEKLGMVYIAETVDCPVLEVYHQAISNSCNRIFMFDRKQYESICEFNPNGVFYMPLGSATQRISELLQDTCDVRYDVSFVGSTYKEKDDYLKLELSEDVRQRLDKLMHRQIEDYPYGIDLLEKELLVSDVKEVSACKGVYRFTEPSVIDMERFIAINRYLTYHMAYLERKELLNLLATELPLGTVNFFTRSDTEGISTGIKLHGGVKTLTEMPFVFRQSRINLNITMRSIQTGIPQRVWDVLACGGFLITNYQPELEDYFEDGVHLVTYRTADELIDKVKYYLAHDKERQEIAQNGFDEVNKNHTVLSRVIEMIKRVAPS